MKITSLLPLIAVLLIGTVAPGLTQSLSNGVAAGGIGTAAENNSPVTTKTTVKAAAFASGWNYKYCSAVWVSPNGSNTVVRIDNSDGSYFTYSTSNSNANSYQQMMFRACRAQGQYYGVRITNTSTGSWDAIVSY